MAKILFIIALLSWGNIGIVIRSIPLESSQVALLRAIIGTLSLLLYIVVTRKKISLNSIKQNLKYLLISGFCVGSNWILLFEAYKNTSISSATVSYYFAPVFVMISTPFLFKEKLCLKHILCITAAVIGLILVNATNSDGTRIEGVIYGLCAAILYGGVIVTNKFFKNISSYERTVLQLGIAAICLFPYVTLTTNFDSSLITTNVVLLLLVLGTVHTGIAYLFFFYGIEKLKSQEVAILSYIDPASAIIFSLIFLNEPITFIQVIGCIFIFGSSIISELPQRKTLISQKK